MSGAARDESPELSSRLRPAMSKDASTGPVPEPPPGLAQDGARGAGTVREPGATSPADAALEPDTAAHAGASAYDCRACGACCFTFDVLLSECDRDRFEKSAALVSLTVLYRPAGASGAWRFMRREQPAQRCAALAGELRSCYCTIYEDRPDLCREFEAGSEDCLQARRQHGIEP